MKRAVSLTAVMAMWAIACAMPSSAGAHGGWGGGWRGSSVGIYIGGPGWGPPVGYYPYPYYAYPGFYPYPRFYPYPGYYPYPAYAVPGPPVYIQKRPVVAHPPAKPAPRRERYTLSAEELFAFDRDELRTSQPKLDEIAVALRANPEITKLTITGYTDRLGSDAYNLELSQRRADAVKGYLIGKGIAANRLIAIGKGKADPLVHCEDRDRAALIKCLQPNRRVEVESITVERRTG